MSKKLKIIIMCIALFCIIVLGISIYTAIKSNNYGTIANVIVPTMLGIFVIFQMRASEKTERESIKKNAEYISKLYPDIIRDSFSNNDELYEKLIVLIIKFMQSKNKRAIKLANDLLKKCGANNERAAVMFFKACALKNNGNNDDAIALYEDLISFEEGFDRAWSNLGLLYAVKGNTEKSKICYVKAISVNPSNVYAMTNYAHLCYEIKDYENAEQLGLKAFNADTKRYNACEI
ncbi:MAG: tetratricopeptide repeat protein, partial [Clostridia bacterium]